VWGNEAMKGWIEQHGELIDVRYLRTPDDFYLRIYFYDPAQNIITEHAERRDD
jgi:hypothetical protein